MSQTQKTSWSAGGDSPKVSFEFERGDSPEEILDLNHADSPLAIADAFYSAFPSKAKLAAIANFPGWKNGSAPSADALVDFCADFSFPEHRRAKAPKISRAEFEKLTKKEVGERLAELGVMGE